MSRIMGWIAVAILLVGLAVWIPQVIETVTHWDVVSGYVDPFVSPINVALAVEYGLLAAGLVAALERALTIRSHWLIDFEFFLVGFVDARSPAPAGSLKFEALLHK